MLMKWQQLPWTNTHPPHSLHALVSVSCCQRLLRFDFPFFPLHRSLSQGSTNSNVLDSVQGGGHKKRARRSSLLNAKKLYEDAQMARKVKQYLSNLNVETNEENIQLMSLQCEPAYGTCEWTPEMFTALNFKWSSIPAFYYMNIILSRSSFLSLVILNIIFVWAAESFRWYWRPSEVNTE